MEEWYQENSTNLKIPVKIFLKCPLWSIAAKLENIWTKIFYRKLTRNRVDEKIFVKFWFYPLTVTPPCFLVKKSQILLKVLVFFPKREQALKTLLWNIWIAQWLTFFRTTAYFSRFWPSSGRKEGSNWTKSVNFVSVPFP